MSGLPMRSRDNCEVDGCHKERELRMLRCADHIEQPNASFAPPGATGIRVSASKGSTERVPFRLIQTPCCGQLLCWVNPRLPNCCPECGTRIYPQVRSCVLVHDEQATLRTTEYYVTTRKP